MTEVPFYAPTAHGPIAGIASLPERSALRGPAVALLSPGRLPRIQFDVNRDVARRLAEYGQPAVRFEHPGAGTDPGGRLRKDAAGPALAEAIEWFRVQTGRDEVALSGSCICSFHAIAAASDNPAVRVVVADDLHFRPQAKRTYSRVRAGVAAVDALAGRAMRGSERANRVPAEDEWRNDLLANIEAATAWATIVFVQREGSLDARDLEEIRSSGRLDGAVQDRLEVAPLAPANEHGVVDAVMLDQLGVHMYRHLRG
jgi:hypothetical protein